MEKEYRKFGLVLEVRANDEQPNKVGGYALLFNSESRDLGFIEVIADTALDGVLEQDDTDVIATYNHDNSKIYARYRKSQENNSLSLRTDEKGLSFEFEAPSWATYLTEGIRRNDFTDCSFAFVVADGGDKWEKLPDGTYKRTILKFDHIYDVAVCPVGAYAQPSCSCRSFDKFKEEEEKLEQEKRNQEEAQRKAELEEYYKQLESENIN